MLLNFRISTLSLRITRAPEWWTLSLNCTLTICHHIVIGKFLIASIIAASRYITLERPVILSVIRRVLWQHRLIREDPTWKPQEGKLQLSVQLRGALMPILVDGLTVNDVMSPFCTSMRDPTFWRLFLLNVCMFFFCQLHYLWSLVGGGSMAVPYTFLVDHWPNDIPVAAWDLDSKPSTCVIDTISSHWRCRHPHIYNLYDDFQSHARVSDFTSNLGLRILLVCQPNDHRIPLLCIHLPVPDRVTRNHWNSSPSWWFNTNGPLVVCALQKFTFALAWVSFHQ